MGADTFLRQTDAFDEVFQRGKLQRGETQSAGYLLHHTLILRSARLGILFEILLVVTLKVLDDAASDEFEVAL